MIHSKHPHHNAVFFFFLNANAGALTAAEVQLQMRNNPFNSLEVCQLSNAGGKTELKGVEKHGKQRGK